MPICPFRPGRRRIGVASGRSDGILMLAAFSESFTAPRQFTPSRCKSGLEEREEGVATLGLY